MRLAPPPLEIDERAGFDGTDIFGYKKFGQNLASLVENLEGPSVVALDGGWGSGKTVFAKQWAGLLRKRGSAVIYFDAFTADAGNDPLFDIASQLFTAAPDGDERRDLAKAAAVFAKRLLPVLAGAGLGVATGGLIGGDAISAGVAGVAEAKNARTDRGEEVSEAFRQGVEDAQGRADALSDLRQKLTALAQSMKAKALAAAEEDVEPSKPRPVVMIVDELDRCKPTYALSLLESIKHIFDVDDLCFVLVINSHQLDRIASTLYGIDPGHRYFEKFFSLIVRLPARLQRSTTSIKEQYFKHLTQNTLADRFPPIGTWIEWMLSIAAHRDWSLRTVEKMMRNMAICLASIHLEPHDPALITVVCSLHADDQDMYSKLRSGTITQSDLHDCLGIDEWERPSFRKRFQKLFEKYFPVGPNDENIDEGAYPDRGVIVLCDLMDRMGQTEPDTRSDST